MAYKNLVNVSCASTKEVFRHLKDWLTKRSGIADYSTAGLGLTVHDYYYAGGNQDAPAEGDWIVFRSAGENGKRSLVFRLLFSSLANGIVRVAAGLSWNATTNAWVVGMYSGQDVPNGPTTGSTFNLSIYGSLDSISIIIGNGSALYGRAIITPDNPMHDDTVALTTSAVSSGSGVVVPVDSVPSSWSVGKSIYVAHDNAQEKTAITAINGLNVTMTLANSYASGARISRDMVMLESYNNYYLGQMFLLLSHSGVSASSNYVSTAVNTTLLSSADPDPSNSCHVPALIDIVGTVAITDGYYGTVRDVLRVSSTGITSGKVYQDDATGAQFRALSIMEDSTPTMYLLREV